MGAPKSAMTLSPIVFVDVTAFLLNGRAQPGEAAIHQIVDVSASSFSLNTE